MGQKIKKVEPFAGTNGITLYYVVYLDPDGFVIVAGDDLVEPIIGFAPGGRYDPSTDNPLGALVSNDLSGRIAKVQGIKSAKAQGVFRRARTKWKLLKNIEQATNGVEFGVSSVSDVRVAPLTETAWSQSTAGGSACYNYYTPPYAAGSSANYVCGCVATAMAQLMRYWQHPANGVGTGSFSITVDDLVTTRNLRGGDGAGGSYVWTNMVLDPTSATVSQRQAIGALCADAGVSVNMDYEYGSSGADTLEAKTAFINTFGYANAIKGYNSGVTIGAGLNGMINPNLDAGCPVLLGITGTPGGHAIVCDGYGYNLSTLYHHLNLGWSGTGTAWYSLPTIDTSIGTFTSVYKCVYNVWTNGTGEIISGRVTDESGSPATGVLITAARSGGGTYTATSDTHGIYALAQIPSSSTYSVSASSAGCSFTNQTVTTGFSSDYASTSGNRWAVDFVQTDSNNPTSFVATPVSSSRIDLSWGKNPSGDDVMVAWNTSATFGTPSGSYSAGDSIAGGGTVLYQGSATTFSHTGLSSGTSCFYKAWSVHGVVSYSSGLSCSATTPYDYLFTENFEHGGLMPGGWAQEYMAGGVSWTSKNGGYNGHPVSPHSGSYNAQFYTSGYGDYRTKLITPMINFGTATRNAQLTFWHCMEPWAGDQDQLRIYYRTSCSGYWSLLATYTNSVPTWTRRTIPLPNPDNTYYVAFEGDANYGYGVCIDDIEITAENAAIGPSVRAVLEGTNFVVNASAGVPNGTYCVLTSTNLALPRANWTIVATNTFDENGCCAFTNRLSPNYPQQFFLIRSP